MQIGISIKHPIYTRACLQIEAGRAASPDAGFIMVTCHPEQVASLGAPLNALYRIGRSAIIIDERNLLSGELR